MPVSNSDPPENEDSSDIKIVAESKVNDTKPSENGSSSNSSSQLQVTKNAMDIDIDLGGDEGDIKKETEDNGDDSAASSESDCLVIDEGPSKKVEKPVTKPPSPKINSNPAKRKRSTSSKTSEEEKPAKTSRRGSINSVKKFDQVENELEAMFAGLEDDNEEVDSKAEVKKAISNSNSSASKKSSTPTVPKRKKSADSEKPKPKIKVEDDADDYKPVKKPVKKVKKPKKEAEASSSSRKSSKQSDEPKNLTQQERLLEKFKGPFVHVEGEIDNPRWSNIINFPNDAIDPHDKSSKNQTPDLEPISRLTGFGYTLTTLNSKYDVRNVDESWICVFCRKASHYCGMGDLFGPYFIESSQWKALSMPSPMKSPTKDVVSSFILGGSDQAGAKAKKRLKKKSGNPQETTPPKSSSSSSKSDHKSEVWFHEDCICWLPQIRLVGNQVLGLTEAIRVTQKSVCTKCNNKGCTIACSKAKCRETVHFPCAQALHWSIDEDKFLALCAKHVF